ncbi:MAG: c-type cytochrome [Verrucomicrobiota bacterium]
MKKTTSKPFELGMLFITLLQSLIYPASTAFRAGKARFIILTLLHSLSIIAVFWVFAGPGVILYFISVVLSFILAVRNRNFKAPEIRYALRTPVMLVPLVILMLGITNIVWAIKDFQHHEALVMQRAEGAKLAKLKCGICHSLKGGGPKVGPPLAGIHMRKIGSIKNFKYSDVFKNADKIWTEEELNAFLANIPAYLKGSNMIIQSIEDEVERKAIIAYLIADPKQLKKSTRKKGKQAKIHFSK